ncbi:MAG TPA: TIM barrel protein [Verrucomicrobiae bacterium]
MIPNQKTTSRRDFLSGGIKSTLGLCAIAALPPFDSPAAGSPDPRGAKLRFGFTSYQWGMDWDIPTIIANLTKAGVFGVELRTSAKYAHGVELELSSERRREVKKRFADSPITLVGIASAERLDWPEPARLKEAVENAKAHIRLSRDVGASGVRVFPNQFHPDVPHEKTVRQIAEALNELGAFAADFDQEVRLEAHGAAGTLPTIRAIMDQVRQPRVRVKLNCDARDAEGEGFEHNFNLVKSFLGHTLHTHNLKDSKFPYQLQTNLLAKMGWDGWALLEASDKVTDRVQALIEQRQIWEKYVANALRV